MSPRRKAIFVCLATAGLLALEPALSAPSPRGPSGGPGYGGAHPSHRPAYPGGHRSYGHYGHSGNHRYYGYYGAPHWGWGLGLGIGIPWALGWYEPWYGPSTYPSYAYGPVYRGYGYACELDEDCWRERSSRSEPAPPTTEVPAATPGEEGGPTQRPLHLNYCDSARAWFPHVRSCPGGWRMILPEYNRQP